MVNQFTIIENRRNRRPDVVIFINGLPLAVIELQKRRERKTKWLIAEELLLWVKV